MYILTPDLYSDINQVNNGVAQSQAAIEAIKALGVNHQELVAALQTRQTGSVITDLSTLLSGLSDTLTGVCDLRDDISSLTASLGL